MRRAMRYAIALVGIVLASGGGLAQVPDSERIPVTDPDAVEKMGFERDARNVFVWSKADLGQFPASNKAAETWGTAAGYTTVPAFALQAERPEFSTIIRDSSRARCNENTSDNDEVEARAIVQ